MTLQEIIWPWGAITAARAEVTRLRERLEAVHNEMEFRGRLIEHALFRDPATGRLAAKGRIPQKLAELIYNGEPEKQS